MAELVACQHVFSNGSEYMYFIETQCDQCTRFRNGRCRTFVATEKARWNEKYFPYNDLMEYAGGCAGKKCRRFTTAKPVKKWHRHEVDGQLALENLGLLK